VIEVPPVVVQNVSAAFGDDGRRWLRELPALLDEVARDWGLRLEPPYPLSFHWVCPVRRDDGTPAVLKLGPPADGHLAVEAATLAAYRGNGAVRLLAHDAGRGALLLERAEPGTMARRERDIVATAALITVMCRLHTAPVPDGLPDLMARDVRMFDTYLASPDAADPDPAIPRRLVERARELLIGLSTSASRRVLLHGDLHHDNVLRARREPWLAIDPHGVVGDRGYEVGAMLYNPDPQRRDPELLALVPSRVEQLADGLGMPIERVRAWGFVQGVLSEVWTWEGGELPGSRALDVALLLEPLIRHY
jgi:streptomycin 6-kinase